MDLLASDGFGRRTMNYEHQMRHAVGLIGIPDKTPPRLKRSSRELLCFCWHEVLSSLVLLLIFFFFSTRPLTMSPSGPDKLKNFSEVSAIGEEGAKEGGRDACRLPPPPSSVISAVATAHCTFSSLSCGHRQERLQRGRT